MAFLVAFSAALKPHPARTNHVELANVICGHKTAVYIWRRWDKVTPQVDPANGTKRCYHFSCFNLGVFNMFHAGEMLV